MRPFLALVLCVISLAARAETATVAVATNFLPLAQTLGADFGAASGHDLVFVGGATGKLAAQIRAGAPFDLFLSADAEAPAALERDGQAVAGTRATYATGRLVLWAPRGGPQDSARDILEAAQHVAVANPDLAPYGRATMQAIAHLGLTALSQGKIVTGQNIGQAFALVQSGAAGAGFVAAAATVPAPLPGRLWPVPQDAHDPIRQDAVLLTRGRDNAAAKAFLAYLLAPDTQAVIGAAGYGVVTP